VRYSTFDDTNILSTHTHSYKHAPLQYYSFPLRWVAIARGLSITQTTVCVKHAERGRARAGTVSIRKSGV
jgi:hypothetical protein